MSAKLQQVHVRVNDAATGKPTPCRVRFTDAEGNYYAPHGRTPRLWSYPVDFPATTRAVAGTLSDIGHPWAYIDGTCEIDLPPGQLRVEAGKGPEYESLDVHIQLLQGKLSLRFTLNRKIDPAIGGWYSGSMVRTTLSPHEVFLEGAAEGLRVVDLLAYERETTKEGEELFPITLGLGPADAQSPAAAAQAETTETLIDYPNLLAFSGQRPYQETSDCLLAVNTFNNHRILGDLILLNCHRIVFPLRFGRSHLETSVNHKPDNWTLSNWCDQCHRKKGLVIARGIDWLANRCHGGEALANLILGKVDALAAVRNYQTEWYSLLSVGVRTPIVSGQIRRPIGSCRTYVGLEPGQEFTYANWIEAIRSGRTVVSYGPFLSLTVDGKPPGAQIDLASNAKVGVCAEAKACACFDRIEIVQNGEIIHSEIARQEGLFTAHAAKEIEIKHSGWLAARCIRNVDSGGSSWVNAHTSPVYVRVNNEPPTVSRQAVAEIISCLDRTLAWVEHDADCETPKDRERLAQVFVDAKKVLLGKLAH